MKNYKNPLGRKKQKKNTDKDPSSPEAFQKCPIFSAAIWGDFQLFLYETCRCLHPAATQSLFSKVFVQDLHFVSNQYWYFANSSFGRCREWKKSVIFPRKKSCNSCILWAVWVFLGSGRNILKKYRVCGKKTSGSNA